MKQLKKDELNNFLGEKLKDFNLIAPVEIEKGKGSAYRLISTPTDISLKYRNTKKSAKEIFFPQDETMFYFKKGEETLIEPLIPKKETILFGVRSCDLRGIEMFDKVFIEGQFVDPYYAEKRNNTIIAALACFNWDDYCFCESIGINRFESRIADLTFFDIGDFYIIKAQSEKGEKLIKDLSDAEQKILDIYEKKRKEAKNQEKIDVEEFMKNINENFEHPIWDDVSQRCIGCSICAYLCPTCHCFDVNDEIIKDKGRRYRTWDACMFPKFTIHTSGHNPRTKNSQRMRQRILHKFNYLDKNKNIIACSGCGRCILNCPVNLDIRDILKDSPQQSS